MKVTRAFVTFGITSILSCVVVPMTWSQQADGKRPDDVTEQSDVPEQPTVESESNSDGGEADTESSVGRSFWMDQKLRLSKDILTGLAMADFESIGKNAEVMQGLNRVENFVRGRTQGYRDQLRQFNLANKALLRASREENLDGATLAFNQLTISCVNCHKSLREENEQPDTSP